MVIMLMKHFLRATAVITGVTLLYLGLLDVQMFSFHGNAAVTPAFNYQNESGEAFDENSWRFVSTTNCSSLGNGSLEVSSEMITCKQTFLETLREEKGGALFNVSMKEELEWAIAGTPFHPLNNYQSPCWVSRTSSFTPGSCHEAPSGSWALRCSPAIYLPGFPKSGSSDVFQTLTNHPLIISGKSKEVGYWNERRLGLYKAPVREPYSYQRYVDHFSPAVMAIRSRNTGSNVNESTLCEALEPTAYNDGYIVDGTPSYIFSYEHWEKMPVHQNLEEPSVTLAHSIHRVNPRAKIIIVMRNPIDRTYSHFRQRDRYSTVEVFHAVVKVMIETWEQCLQNHTKRHCLYTSDLLPCNKFFLCGNYIRPSMYAQFIVDWMTVFPKENFLFIKSEEYFEDRIATLKRVVKFLDLSDLSAEEYAMIDAAPVRNKRKQRGLAGDVMMDETRALLRTFFTEHVREVARLLGDDRFLWDFDKG